MAVTRMTGCDDCVDVVQELLYVFGFLQPSRIQQVPKAGAGERDVIAEGVDVTDSTEQKALDRPFAGKNVHDAIRCLDDVEHPADVHAGFLDVPDIVEGFRQACDQRGRHVDIGGERIVVQHDRNRHGFRDCAVIRKNLVVGRRVIIGRHDHQAVGPDRFRLAAVTHGNRRVGIHRADQHLDPAGDVSDCGFDQYSAFRLGDGQKLSAGAEDDDTGYLAGNLPVEEMFQ